MGELLKDLADVSPEAVQHELAILKQLVKEDDPEIDVLTGPIHDLVLYPSAVLSAHNATQIQDVLSVANLRQILDDPEAAPDKRVDEIAASWNVRRRKASKASGQVRIVLRRKTTLIIPAGTIFEVDGVEFKTMVVRTLRPFTASLKARDGGVWSGSFPVVAVKAGVAGNISGGTRLKCPTLTSPDIRNIVAKVSFTGGLERETNRELLGRLTAGYAGQHWANKDGIVAGFRKEFGDNVDLSIISFGDKEMLRDQQMPWPGSMGGKVDVYAQTSPHPVVLPFRGIARRIATDDNGSVWQAELAHNVCFYDVVGITPLDGKSPGRKTKLELTQPIEKCYSATHSATLTFKDAWNNDFVDEREFTFDLLCMPHIAEMQQYVDQRVTNMTTDIMVKGAIPCFTKIHVTLVGKSNNPDKRAADIKRAIMHTINNGPIGMGVGSMRIVTCAWEKANEFVLQELKVSGYILCPDGTIEHLEEGISLRIPTIPEKMVSPNTTTCLQKPSDISVVLNSVDN